MKKTDLTNGQKVRVKYLGEWYDAEVVITESVNETAFRTGPDEYVFEFEVEEVQRL